MDFKVSECNNYSLEYSAQVTEKECCPLYKYCNSCENKPKIEINGLATTLVGFCFDIQEEIRKRILEHFEVGEDELA